MGANFGLTPRPPVTTNELRRMIGVIDFKLKESTLPGRLFFSPREMQDLLLDVRNMLDTLTSPSNLVAIAAEIAGEGRSWEKLLEES